MNERDFFDLLLLGWLLLAVIVFISLFFVAAPYGRHIHKGWGPSINNRLGWVIMEAPAALVFAVFFVTGDYRDTATVWTFLLIWEIHYVHRAFIYPFGLKGAGKQMPLAVVGMAFAFNCVNGYINGRYLFTFSGGYANDWLGDPRFIAGLVIFTAGYALNRHADTVLRRLRRGNENGYAIPHGALYRWISCPNYFGEIIEWFGWALLTWSPAGLVFALWVTANLVPRAKTHHQWYGECFADYPPERKALIPRLW